MIAVIVNRGSTSRQRMIRSAAVLMRTRGVEATSFSEVLALAKAPRGSIYHHFPGGKAQLIEEATLYAGEFTALGLTAALAQDDAVAAVSDFAAGCPVVAATLEGDRSPGAREAAALSFRRWEDLLTEGFERHIASGERARSLATLVIAALEGAVVLARADRSTAPVERVARELERQIVAALS
jgi:TetR/AcrR family transcriptional regulator, lmrAB and yxaGH operons repressor